MKRLAYVGESSHKGTFLSPRESPMLMPVFDLPVMGLLHQASSTSTYQYQTNLLGAQLFVTVIGIEGVFQRGASNLVSYDLSLQLDCSSVRHWDVVVTSS